MRDTITRTVKRSLHRYGVRHRSHATTRRRRPSTTRARPTSTTSTKQAYREVHDFTMTGPEKVYALRQAICHVVTHDIPGAIVECGVWRGGSMMAAAATLLELGDATRELYLFDTYEGMPEPTEHDVDLHGNSSYDRWTAQKRNVLTPA